MNKVLGIDLGSNSIGLTLRNEDEFEWYGVYTFKTGVGRGKSGEFSYAAERTKHRSSRRLYNARRYRKWETLRVLIKYDFCPLQEENLDKWKHYKKGIGRMFPVDDQDFDQWIKLDFDGDGKPDFSSPYQLRRFLIQESLNLDDKQNRYKVGRALYHITQRRGFKSSRKNGKSDENAVYKGSSETSATPYNIYKEELKHHITLGSYFAFLEDEQARVRNRYTLRKDYKDEVLKLLSYQNLNGEFEEEIIKAIFYQRPLRSQKGLVGKCTLESNKSRCPISHPSYEEFRALQFINNIKFKDEDENWQQLPAPLRKKLFEDKFFLQTRFIDFATIREFIEKNGGANWELNYKKKADSKKVSTCPVSARLKDVFGEDWRSYQKKVTRINKKGEEKDITYDIYDIWHILFSFEDEEYLEEFCIDVLGFSEEQYKKLYTIWNNFPVGYASLSLKAIDNILPFLREGLIYTEAVLLAKIPEIIENEIFQENKGLLLNEIKNLIKENRYEKQVIQITNNLISSYFLLEFENRFGVNDKKYRLQESDITDVQKACLKYFGENNWNNKNEITKKEIVEKVTEKYQEFFALNNRAYFSSPRLFEQLKSFIDDNFNPEKETLNKLYHPSEIDIYQPSTQNEEDGNYYLPSPETRAFKNPMAYKALYNLRKVINYLIKINKINQDTRLVVEIARELNDANERKAIERYQNKREKENQLFAATIAQLIKDPDFKGNADSNKKEDTDKFRLWVEQIPNYETILKEVDATKDDVKKYRLWKEQGCICMYTGKLIKLTDLFDENIIDFEHTIPRSKSFDNSLANLTVCYADYNRKIKKNQIPFDLPNYNNSTAEGSAIKPRLDDWIERRDRLKDSIEYFSAKAKSAQDKESKDQFIQSRHMKKKEYDYWKNKIDRFTRKDIPEGFKSSQLIDTQIISKYAYHYLKTAFNRVDVEKGSATEVFRKIFKIQPREEKKDRSKHHHHAIDAAVLSLIPRKSKRNEILKKWYESLENQSSNKAFAKPFEGFSNKMITDLQEDILINNIPDQNQALTPAKKYFRNRGRQIWLRDKKGNILFDKEGKKKAKIATGDSIRGQLHLDTFYGKIKIAAKDENGSLQRDEQKNIIYNQIDGKDEMWMVLRKSIESVNFKTDVIVDEHLVEYLRKQIEEGKNQNDLKDFQGNTLRHIRCRVKAARGFMKPDNATIVKEQVYKSSKDYKNFIYADSGENYMFGLYENGNGKSIVPFNIVESVRYNKHIDEVSPESLFKSKEPIYIGRGNKAKEAFLEHIFMIGQKVLLFENDKEELKDLGKSDLSKRLYFVKRLADANTQRILFQHHLEARDDKQLTEDFPKEEFGTRGKDGFSKFSSDFVAPRLLLTPGNFNFIIEEKDFNMKLDSTLNFNF